MKILTSLPIFLQGNTSIPSFLYNTKRSQPKIFQTQLQLVTLQHPYRSQHLSLYTLPIPPYRLPLTTDLASVQQIPTLSPSHSPIEMQLLLVSTASFAPAAPRGQIGGALVAVLGGRRGGCPGRRADDAPRAPKELQKAERPTRAGPLLLA